MASDEVRGIGDPRDATRREQLQRVTLSPDGNRLYAVNAAANSIAVIDIDKRGDRGSGPRRRRYEVIGLLPTAYEPHDITFSADGTWAYVINGKSLTTANPLYPTPTANQYQFQLERASLVAQPVVTGERGLEALTDQVASNNFYDRVSERDKAVFAFLRKRIKHVIYIIKENRTFDQILGDLTNGANADPSLTHFPRAITPSLHKLATEFVTIDNFMDAGDGSMDGWSWGLQGRVTNTEALTQQISYSFIDRGLSYESEGTNRNLPVQWSTVAERDAVSGPPGTTAYSDATAGLPGGSLNALAGSGDHALSDAPFAEQGGYIYQAVLAAGGTVRSYGTLSNNIGSIGTKESPIIDPFASSKRRNSLRSSPNSASPT